MAGYRHLQAATKAVCQNDRRKRPAPQPCRPVVRHRHSEVDIPTGDPLLMPLPQQIAQNGRQRRTGRLLGGQTGRLQRARVNSQRSHRCKRKAIVTAMDAAGLDTHVRSDRSSTLQTGRPAQGPASLAITRVCLCRKRPGTDGTGGRIDEVPRNCQERQSALPPETRCLGAGFNGHQTIPDCSKSRPESTIGRITFHHVKIRPPCRNV